MTRFLLLIALLGSNLFAAEQYIVPVVASVLLESPYRSTLALTNTSSNPVAFHVVEAYPLETISCTRYMPCATSVAGNLRPRETTVFSDGGGIGLFISARGGVMKIGAVLLESEQPLLVQSEAFRSTNPDFEWQPVEIARQWVTGETVIPRVLGAAPANLFLINPNDTPADFAYWSDYGGSGSATAGPKSSILVVLPADFLCPRGCGGGLEPPFGSALPLHIRSTSRYMAAVSVRTSFLPPTVRIARPVE